MKPLLSILIPTRNRANYVRYAIQSALNIPSDRVEVLVSENHGADDGLAVCQSFNDPRLRVMRPDSPLPMHENWEMLLKESTGEWVTFIGDDDAIMPHAVKQLEHVGQKYPEAEALVSPRAYYFWDGIEEEYGNACMEFEFTSAERWRDSKADMQLALDQKLHYLHLPQMYSGGFQRRSMIQRVLRAQQGRYFQSVTPDAYSALMACLHTYRFLEIGVPMSWVGSSPHNALKSANAKASGGNAKDRYQDFFGFHSDEVLTTHKSLGDMQNATFGIFFFESYLSAFPMTSYKELSMDRVRKIFHLAADELRASGRADVVPMLAKQLGFDVPPVTGQRGSKAAVARVKKKFNRLADKIRAGIGSGNESIPTKVLYRRQSESHGDFPHVSSADDLLAEGYAAWLGETQHASADTQVSRQMAA